MTRGRHRGQMLSVLCLVTAFSAACTQPISHAAHPSHTSAAPSTDPQVALDSPAAPSGTLSRRAPASRSKTGSPDQAHTPTLPTCTTSQLHLTVQRGSSASQQAFATVTLQNQGPACATGGFPGVSLLRAGTEIGAPARRIPIRYSTINLAPRASAHASFVVSTSCNAARSDHLRVFPPDQSAPLTAPLSVFACASNINPLQSGPA